MGMQDVQKSRKSMVGIFLFQFHSSVMVVFVPPYVTMHFCVNMPTLYVTYIRVCRKFDDPLPFLIAHGCAQRRLEVIKSHVQVLIS